LTIARIIARSPWLQGLIFAAGSSTRASPVFARISPLPRRPYRGVEQTLFWRAQQ
jgi:hypothetical protein